MTAPHPDDGTEEFDSSATAAEETPGGDEPGEPGETDAAPTGCAQCAGYLDALTRLKAEFANYRRRASEQQAQSAERGAADLATGLLAVLDAAEAGAAHDEDLVGPLHGALVAALTEGGLEVISPEGEPFDPQFHEAVVHEAGETPGPQLVTDVLRTGYAWRGRVLRPATVGVRG